MLTMLAAAIPDADPLPLPAPIAILRGLLLLTFFLHVVAMNFVLGGSIIAVVARLRGGEGSSDLVKFVSKAMPTMIAAAVTFGVAPLLFLQALYGRLFFTSSVLMAWLWFAVVPLLIAAYYGAYALSFRGEKLGRAGAIVAGAMALIFVAIAFIYVSNMTLMLRPERFLPMFLESARGLHLNGAEPTLAPRYLHMLLGAVAVAGLGLALRGGIAAAAGLRWFVGATIVNMLTGVWWMVTLPREVLLRFMGRSPLGTAWFGLGSVAGVAALVAAVIALRGRSRGWVHAAGALTGVTLALMILARDQVRLGMLERAGFAPAAWIEPQWGVMVAFALLLVVGIGTTVWMVSLLKAPRHTSS